MRRWRGLSQALRLGRGFFHGKVIAIQLGDFVILKSGNALFYPGCDIWYLQDYCIGGAFRDLRQTVNRLLQQKVPLQWILVDPSFALGFLRRLPNVQPAYIDKLLERRV